MLEEFWVVVKDFGGPVVHQFRLFEGSFED